MTRKEAESLPLAEVALAANYLIGRAMGHPLVPYDAKEAFSLIGVLLTRIARELDAKGGAK
jgi:hypothetical protein